MSMPADEMEAMLKLHPPPWRVEPLDPCLHGGDGFIVVDRDGAFLGDGATPGVLARALASVPRLREALAGMLAKDKRLAGCGMAGVIRAVDPAGGFMCACADCAIARAALEDRT